MKITLTSTDQMGTLNGVPGRFWQGTAALDAGEAEILAFIPFLGTKIDTPPELVAEFHAQLVHIENVTVKRQQPLPPQPSPN